ncbi:uncharacterized protein LOC135473346 [Liolophura sinensis]|uniref:uncharacterized protein LOC135473346 n=1 Tax=Liolophura sinensis TaxID=3198878 RepID=UPI0031583A8D
MAETNHTPAKPDIDALFQSVGSKLGWFQFKDVDSAIKSLSQSGKKKSSRSRVFETSAQKKTPSKNFRKPSKDKDVTKKKSSRKKPKSTIENHANQSSKIVTSWTDDKSLSVDHSMKSSPEVPHGVSIASSPENIPVESTRIGSSVFRTDSNSFVNLTLSPVNACDSVSNIEELSDSYKALKINAQRRKSRQSRGGELDLTEQKYTTCFPEDDEIFYSVLDPKGSNSSTSSQQKSGSQSSQGSEQSEYVEVEDKAVSTGSLELALCDNEDLDYEQDRTFFTSWAVPQQERHKKNNVNTSDKNSEDQINDQLLRSDKKLDSDSLEEMASSSISKKCGSVEESSSMSGSSSASGYCEVEDKCVGPSPSGSLNDSQMSAHSENSLGRSSPMNASKQILQNDCLSKNTSPSDSPSVNSSLSDILADGSPENDSPQNHSPHHDPSSGNSSPHELIPNPLNTTKYFDSIDRRISSLHFSTDVSRRSSVYHDATEELKLPSIDSGVEPKGYLVTSGVESLVDLSVTDSGSATSQRACENGNKTKGRPAMEQSLPFEVSRGIVRGRSDVVGGGVQFG